MAIPEFVYHLIFVFNSRKPIAWHLSSKDPITPEEIQPRIHQLRQAGCGGLCGMHRLSVHVADFKRSGEDWDTAVGVAKSWMAVKQKDSYFKDMIVYQTPFDEFIKIIQKTVRKKP